MMRWMMGILITICVLIIISVVLLFTPVGLKITLNVAEKFVPGDLTYKTISGPAIGPINITHLTYRYKKTYIYIKKLHFQWRPEKLFQGKLDIKKMHASGVRIVLPSKDAQSFAIPTFTLPIELHVNKATIRNIKVGRSAQHYPLQIALLTLHGKVTANELRADIKAHLKQPYAANLHLVVSGTLNNYRLKLMAKSRDIDWTIHGTGGRQWVHLTMHQAHTLGGSLNGDVSFHWAPSYRWKINLNAYRLNLRTFYKEWPQRLSVKLLSQGKLESRYAIFSLKTDLQTPGVLIQLSGNHDRQWNIKWKISAAQLSTLLASYSGALHGMGTIKGNTLKPVWSGKLTGKDVSLFGYRVGELSSRWQVDLSYHQTSRLEFNAQNFATRRMRLSKFSIDATGKPHAHQINALFTLSESTIGTTRINLVLNGQLMKKSWQGYLRRLTIQSRMLGRWRLNNPAQMRISTTQITSTPICIRSTRGRACLQGEWHRQQAWQMQLTASGINITPVLTLFKLNLHVQTPVTINAKATGQGAAFKQAMLTMKFGRGSFYVPAGVANARLRFSGGTLIATLDAAGLNANLQLNLSSRDTINARIMLPGYALTKTFSPTQPLQGIVNINATNLKILGEIIPNIIKPKGKLQASLNISGTLAKPSVSGQIKLQQGSVQIPELHLTLTNINIDLSASGATIIYDIQAYSQHKLIQVSGKTQLDAPGRPTQLKIQSNDVLVMNTAEYIIYATTALIVDIKGHQIHVGGVVTIPCAVLKPIAFNGVVTLPEDVVFVGPTNTKQSHWYVTTNIKIVIGNNVKIDSHGLTGRLTGQLVIIKKPAHTYIVDGKIGIIGGVFTTHGKTLIIERGSAITFTQSPLKNPNLSIRAVKKIQAVPQAGVKPTAFGKITVGLNIQGTLRHPNVSLFSSSPQLTQADILSYLLFGHPANVNTPSNVSFLLQAIDTLNLGGGKATPGGIGDQIAQGLGLSEFGLESETTLDALGTPLSQGQSAFVVGRYISPRIYVRYSRGLVVPINIVQIRYLFGVNWAIQTESSSLGNGVDMLYTIQKK